MKLPIYITTVLFAVVTVSVSSQEPGGSSEAPPISAFAQLPRMQKAVLSPDGSHIAYLFPFSGRNHIVMQPLGDVENRKIVPPAGDLEYEWMHWASDERLVFSASFFGNRLGTDTKETRLASIRKDGSDLQWFIRSAGTDALSEVEEPDPTSPRFEAASNAPPQVQDDVISWLPEEPGYILVALDEDFDGKDEVRRVDIASGEYVIVRGGLPGIQHWMVDANNELRMGFGYNDETFTLQYLSPEQEWIDFTLTDWWADGWQPVAFAESPEVAYAIGPGETGRDVVRKLNVKTGALLETVFDAGDYDVTGVVLDQRTRRPVGVSYLEHQSAVKYFDKEYDRLQRTAEKAFKGRSVNLVSLSSDRQQLLVEVSSDTDPGVLYYWNRQAKSMDVVTEYMPDLAPEQLSPVKAVRYPARDGYTLNAYLTLPLNGGTEKLPTVIFPRGELSSRSDKSFGFLSQFFASRGYAVLQPNYRGTTGRGVDHFQAGRGQWGRLMQDDVTDATRWLIESGVADPDRVCIAGWSYGGYVAAISTVMTPDLYRCAASINGPLDLPELANNPAKKIVDQAWTQDFGVEGKELDAISPYQQAKRIQVPLLLVQADDDVRVPRGQAERLETRLQKQKTPVERVEVPGGGHDMNTEEARTVVLKALEQFLSRHLGS